MQVEQPKDFNGRVFELMKGALNIKGDLSALQDAPEEEPSAAKVEKSRPPPHPPPPPRVAFSLSPFPSSL